jgi:hypothetical protein
MSSQRAALVAREHGLITARSALDASLDRSDIARLLHAGEWIAVRRGVYADASDWEAADPWRDRPLLRVKAAHLALGRRHHLSHDSAALLHDLPLLPDEERLVHVTREDITGGRRRHGIAQHGAPITPAEATRIDGLPVLRLARTALDIGREHGYDAGLVACDGALRRGVPRSALDAAATAMRNWPGIKPARAAVADADPGAESAGESLGRTLVRELQVGEVATQFPVLLSDGRTAWLDMLVGCHAFEFDGRIKYQPTSNGGVASRSPEDVVWEEKKRERLIRELGLGVSRIIWADLFGDARRVAVARLRRDYELTRQLHGETPSPALLEYAARMTDARARRLRHLAA